MTEIKLKVEMSQLLYMYMHGPTLYFQIDIDMATACICNIRKFDVHLFQQ